MTTTATSTGTYLRAVALAIAVTTLAFGVNAAQAQSKAKAGAGKFNPDDPSVDLFDAIDAGQIDVKFIPKDSSQANVTITNKTKKPLNVKLPAAFAAAPVLAQLGGGLGGGGARPGMGGQMMGGGMGGMGGGMGGGMMGGMGGMGGGMFNVPAEKVGKFKVTCVCLEHGKPEPRPAMAYRIMRISDAKVKEGVRELCALVGAGKIDQRAAQAAAWYLNSGMNWDALAAKRIENVVGPSEPYFSEEQLRSAMSIANESMKLAAENPGTPAKSPGETPKSEGGLADDAQASASGKGASGKDAAGDSVATDKTQARRRARAR
ncbi:MAG TPA: hypothetical protein VHD36_23470 [Pirellulales bacterium]|nr:hypothetical protein [Pirellulales bacterium]